MAIAIGQVQNLFRSIMRAEPDRLDCDGCFDLMAQLADAELKDKPLDDYLQAVRQHLSQCACCAYEYETLLEALDAADNP